MAQLELTYIRMFAEEGDPGWHAGQLDDGRRVHATAIPCGPGVLHWSGSVEDSTACECDGTGACNLCRIRQDGGLVFTRVTGCYRSANSAVRALKFWANHPDAPQPPAPFKCDWITMQAVLCRNEPDAPPMPLGTTERPMLTSQDADQQREHASPDRSRVEYADHDDPRRVWRDLMMNQITPESLDECSESGHPRQAWLILSEEQEEATSCPTCGQVPEFWEKMSGDNRALDFDFISEILNETHMASHEVMIDDDDDDDITFVLETHVFQHAKEWPKAGSMHLTHLPYPGDDAITLRWFHDDWNRREEKLLGEDEVLLDPNTREPLTDETLREYMAECHDEGFSYESSATDIVNVTRDIDDDEDEAE